MKDEMILRILTEPDYEFCPGAEESFQILNNIAITYRGGGVKQTLKVGLCFYVRIRLILILRIKTNVKSIDELLFV